MKRYIRNADIVTDSGILENHDIEIKDNKITDITNLGKSEIVFIIGSSFGLSKKVKDVSDFKLSVSKLTFPHQLLRVILHETIYRSLSIINGTKYHK